MPNRLASETSPYLLQHADNPVRWYPWGEDAFAEARAKDKPILLSVGYSACHWCHVMAHESFEDPVTAALMNELFVNIKVDREERPDVDGIYMQAVQSMTGRGGWPMTVFLTPDGRPFYGGTYYPPEDRHGLPGFPRVLTALAGVFKNNRDDIERTAAQLHGQLAAGSVSPPGATLLAPSMLDRAFEAIAGSYDRANGGFAGAPKFPQPMTLDFLLRFHHRSRRPLALEMVEHTLQKMARGGMYDQAGGGFHRYSTDAVWLVPHFEKMLYDNALLARVYLDAFKVTGKSFYRRICEETLDYVLREMTDPSGGFYSTQDADSEGVEGKFFLWTPVDFEAVLGPEHELFAEYFDVTPDGNFEEKSILHVDTPPDEFAAGHGLSLEQLEKRLSNARTRLYAARQRRVHPGRDEKVLTAWNGMMLRALAEAARALDSPPYLAAAVRNADFLLAEMRKDGRVLRTWKAGTARLKGYLEDYACLIDGLIAAHEATLDLEYLRAAIELAGDMLGLFWDGGVEGFFDTGSDHEELITRPRDFFDNATPSGTSVAADVLLRLAVITGNSEYERKAVACVRAIAPLAERAPTGFGRLLAALDFHLSRPVEVAIVWHDDLAAAAPLAAVAFSAYRPHLVAVGARAGEGGDLTPLLLDRPAAGRTATAYVCERFACQEPASDPDQLRRQLDGAGGR